MTRRRNSPSRRPLGTGRPSKDREAIESELRAARANRKADHQQKQALRRREWDDDRPAEDETDAEMFAEEPAEESAPEGEDEPAPKKKPGRS